MVNNRVDRGLFAVKVTIFGTFTYLYRLSVTLDDWKGR